MENDGKRQWSSTAENHTFEKYNKKNDSLRHSVEFRNKVCFVQSREVAHESPLKPEISFSLSPVELVVHG